MALKPSIVLCLVLSAAVWAPSVRAEDSRIEKAKKARDEILEKRRTQPAGAAMRPDAKPEAEDPFQAAARPARERLAAIDAQIEEKRRQSEATAAPREKLQAKSDDLARQVSAIQEQNRARVEAIYRSAKLGAGAAGWHPEPARSARLSRYLASVAAVQQKKLEVVEVEHGSVIASLDKARADDAAAQNELRALDADRAEAEASLARALADAGAPRAPGLTPEEAEAEALAQEHAAGLAGLADAPIDSPETGADSALAVERAMALLEAKTGLKAAPAPTDTAAPGDDGEFTWPAPAGPGGSPNAATNTDAAGAEARALAEAKAALEAKAVEDRKAAEEEAAAQAAEEKAAAAAKAAEAKIVAEAQQAARAAEEKAAAEKQQAAKAAEEKAAAEAALARAKLAEDAHGTSGELEDGPAVLASNTPAGADEVASAAAQPGGVAADAATNADAAPADSDKPKRPGLLSRFFGSDRESDEFAASRGTLPAPVAGKVVANYGQQHKSGATYRGVILRAGHSAPIKAVAGGKVSFAGNVPGLGNTVIVSHGGRYHTVYARLGSLEVKEGQSIGGGTEIGTLPADNADMHFELRDQGKAVDPVPWLKGGLPGAAQ